MRMNTFKDQLTGRHFEIVSGKLSEVLSELTKIDKEIAEYDISSLKFIEEKVLTNVDLSNNKVYKLTFNDNSRLELTCDPLDEVIIELAIKNMKRPKSDDCGEKIRYLTSREIGLVRTMRVNRLKSSIFDWLLLWSLIIMISTLAINVADKFKIDPILFQTFIYAVITINIIVALGVTTKISTFIKTICSKRYLSKSELDFVNSK